MTDPVTHHAVDLRGVDLTACGFDIGEPEMSKDMVRVTCPECRWVHERDRR